MNKSEFEALKTYILDTGYEVRVPTGELIDVEDESIAIVTNISHSLIPYSTIKSNRVKVMKEVRNWRMEL